RQEARGRRPGQPGLQGRAAPVDGTGPARGSAAGLFLLRPRSDRPVPEDSLLRGARLRYVVPDPRAYRRRAGPSGLGLLPRVGVPQGVLPAADGVAATTMTNSPRGSVPASSACTSPTGPRQTCSNRLVRSLATATA